VKGEYDGRVLGEMGGLFLGRKHFFEGAFGGQEDFLWHIFLWDIGWFEQFGFWVNHCRGHRVAGGFGHGGQDSFRFPGAREPDRLLLAGWEVSRFGQSWVSASGWARKQGKDNQRSGN
jgi:hypothetical protein